MFSLLRFLLWILVLLPPAVFTIMWSRNRQHPFPLAAWGGALVLASFLWLPWLDLQPLKHFKLEWLANLAPGLLSIASRWLGLKTLGDLAGKALLLNDLFAPPGWLTLLLTATRAAWLLTCAGGLIGLLLAISVSLHVRVRGLGWALTLVSLFLLLMLCYHLPEISSLGERPFPSILAIAVPLLGAHLVWTGPVVMMGGLCSMAIAGLVHTHSLVDRPWDDDELYEGYIDIG